MDALTELMDKVVPDLEPMLAFVSIALKVLIVAGPAVMLLLGLYYLLLAPREATHRTGYRTFYGMGSVEAWRFTQKLAGFVWGGLGLGLTVAMIIVCSVNAGKPLEEMLAISMTCILVELGLIVLALLAVELVVVIMYDRDGYRRR